MFNMFSGSTDEVTLLCNLNIREEIMDRFGNKIPLRAYDINHFETTIHAAVSDGLVSWIMQYGSDIKGFGAEISWDMVAEKARKLQNCIDYKEIRYMKNTKENSYIN